MRDIGWLSPRSLELAWGALAVACLGVMVASPAWETIPFHVIWITMTFLYGFRVWSPAKTAAILGGIAIATGASILSDAFAGLQLWGELFEVPLMSAMFLAMVWHARRRQQALKTVNALAEERASMLDQEERLLHNVSHELRTPVTVARGHLELLARRVGPHAELDVAFGELGRIEQIVERTLLLARAERGELIVPSDVPLVPFLEEMLVRWAGAAQRAWRLGDVVDVCLHVDETWLTAALDALLENAVHYTDEFARIEVSAHAEGDVVVIAVEDDGVGIAPDTLPTIFERFARSDESRAHRAGGAGLGLSIVTAIARVHGGSCAARSELGAGSVFELRLPLPQADLADLETAFDSVAFAVPGANRGSA